MTVFLRRYVRADIPTATNLINTKEVRQGILAGAAVPFSLEEQTSWFEKQAIRKPNEGGSFAIIRKEDNALIGGCACREVDWRNSSCSVAIWLGENYCGQGYGSEALTQLVGFIFAELGLRRVWLNVFAFNGRAIRSYQKVGFIEEARLRDRIFRFGRFHDEIIMGILRHEWDKTPHVTPSHPQKISKYDGDTPL